MRKWTIRLLLCLLALICFMTLVACGEEPAPDEGGEDGPEDDKHVHTFDATWKWDESHHWHPATCQHNRQKGDYAEHTYDRGIIATPSGCESEGVIRYTCTVCGATKDESYAPKGHSYGEFEVVTPADCTVDGERVRTCTRCGDTQSEPISRTNHALTDDWSYNETDHWRACKCGQVQESAPHSFVSGYCEVCWAKEGAIETNELLFALSEDRKYYIVKGVGTLSQENLQNPVIPATYKGLPVTAIADEAFRGESGIYSLVIPSHVTSIGKEAFFGCENLARVSIGSGVTQIGSAAFSGCGSLTSLTVSGQNGAFFSENGCLVELSSMRLISSWGNGVIPNGVITIGTKAFWAREGVVSLSIPRTVTIIEDWAFFGCQGLERVALPDGVKEIGAYAFADCGNMRAITLPSTLLSLGERALADCSALQNITLPESLKTIGASCFHGCKSLSSIHIPDGVTAIGYAPLAGCTALATITVGINNPHYYSEGECLMYQKNRKVSTIEDIVLLAGCQNSVIPKNTMIIETGAFYGITGLASVVIPDSVTRIGAAAFVDCRGVTTLTLGRGLATIGDYAFGGCSGITELFIPANVLHMGQEVFSGCGSLAEIRCEAKRVPTTWNAQWKTGCNAVVVYDKKR